MAGRQQYGAPPAANAGNSVLDSVSGFFTGLFGTQEPGTPYQQGHGQGGGHAGGRGPGAPGYSGGSGPPGRGPPQQHYGGDRDGPSSFSQDPRDRDRRQDEWQPPRDHRDRGGDGPGSYSQPPRDHRDRGQYDDYGAQKPWQSQAPSREPSLGQQSTAASSNNGSRSGNYVPVNDDSDLLDQHVAYFFKHHPEVYRRNPVVRKREGVYELHGRELNVEWQYNPDPQKQGFLVIIDWPLRQPFTDYMQQTDANVEYDNHSLTDNRATLSSIPRDQRLTFNDRGSGYSRLEAMKVAKEQACVRERAATYHHQGQSVPQDELMARYEKTMRAKLGKNRQSAQGYSGRSAEPQAAPTPQVPPPAHGYPGASGSGAWPSPAGGGSPPSQGLAQPNLFGGMPQMGLSPYGGASPGGASGGASPGGASPYGTPHAGGSPHGQRYGMYG